jgi:3'-phosphoadenosine 5'-phosphosulfate (PAPS) 3'-phosphatase
VLPEELSRLAGIGRTASEGALEYFRGDYGRSVKADGTLVTDADHAVNDFLTEELTAWQSVPVWSEESPFPPELRDARRAWVVDPIDGTRWFSRGDPEFAIHVAFVDRRGPVLGMVAMPARREVYLAARGRGAWRLRLPSGGPPEALPRNGVAPRILLPSEHSVDRERRVCIALNLLPTGVSVSPTGSNLMALVRGEVAAIADHGARAWDLAAPALVVREAAGSLTDSAGQPLRYLGSAPDRRYVWRASRGLPHGRLVAVTGRNPTAA